MSSGDGQALGRMSSEMESTDREGNVLSPLLTATLPHPADQDSFPAEYCRTPSRTSVNFEMSDRAIASPTPDIYEIRNDNRGLKSKIRQLQSDLKTEQDSVSSLRRKLNSLERERLDAVTAVNEDNSRLDSEVTRLRAQLEKGEAVRQTLEYELAKTRREINTERRSSREREALINEANESLKLRVSDLTSQVEKLSKELAANKNSGSENQSKLQSIIAEKDQVVSHFQTEKEILESEKEKLEAILHQRENAIVELEERNQELEDDKRSQLESLHRHVGENELLVEKEKRLKLDLETANDKIKTIEESIEAERAAHLETKFNSEIVQLRIRDLEGALNIEKKAKTEVLTTSEKLNKQLRTEKEHSLLNKHLHSELEEKKHVIQKLSEQLEMHQTEFDELKQELSKARKRQVFLEENYNGSTKELQILVENFRLDATAVKTKRAGGKKKEPSKTQLLSNLLEEMRGILIDYKRKLDGATGDVTRLETQNKHLSEECSQYKEMMWAKDKTLETTQQNFTRASKDLRKIQNECKERDPVVKELQHELNEVKNFLERERKQAKELNDQMRKVASKCKTDEQTSAEFMHSLYRQLQIVHQIPKSQEVAVQSWADLAMAVNDQVVATINKIQKLEEKTKHLGTCVNEKETTMVSLQKSHEEQLEKMAKIADSRTQQWKQQKADMEKHYSQLLAEIHARHKKTQSLADQAWEKIRMTGTVQQGLESECSQVRAQLKDCQKEHDTLLTTCALLIGAFYPLYARNNALAAERLVLAEQVSRFDAFKAEIQVLVDALALDGDSPPNTPRGRHLTVTNPLLRFRVAAITIMGANRLMHGLQNKCHMFAVNDVLPGIQSMLVCTGGIETKEKAFPGTSNRFILEEEKAVSSPEANALSWLGSNDLLSTILATVSDLQVALEKARAGETGYDTKKLINVTRNTFKKLICHFPSTFPCIATEPYNGMREKASLVRFLGHGLNRALAHTSLNGRPNLMGSRNTLAALQNHILEFTKRLHTAEVERRDLRLDVNRQKKDLQAYEQTSDAAHHLRHEVNNLREELDCMVTQERFESVCQELNQALHREQQAQGLLNEQSHQINSLGLQLDMRAGESSDKGTELSKALKREQKAQNLVSEQSRQINSLGMQVDAIRSELALKDKKINDEMEACQGLLSKYVSNEKQLKNKVELMKDEVQQQKEHINLLKKELADACRREYDDELAKLKLMGGVSFNGQNDRSGFWPTESNVRDMDFVPLQEEDETLPTKLTTPQMRVTSRSNTATPEYKTPQTSQKAVVRRKGTKGKH